MNAQALSSIEEAAAAGVEVAPSPLVPRLPAADVLDLVDGFHAGSSSFQSTWVHLGELGCSRHVLGAFLHEALELGGGRR